MNIRMMDDKKFAALKMSLPREIFAFDKFLDSLKFEVK